MADTKRASILAFISLPVVVVLMLFWVVFFVVAPANACAGGLARAVDLGPIGTAASVDGYGHDQLVNAALIANAAVALGMPAAAQTLAIQAAMGESSLTVIDHGDAAGPDSRGLFQQRDNGAWGSYADRMDPTVSATNFLKALQRVPDWETISPPSHAINMVQRNSDPEHYTKFRASAEAVVRFLSGDSASSSPGCILSGDAHALASALWDAHQTGRLDFADPAPEQQIQDLAAGTATADCQIDVRVLQIITIALEQFDQVSVSSLNRYCERALSAAGTSSLHYANGGGHAVDFVQFNHEWATGCDDNSIHLLRILDPRMPKGSGAGQEQCRSTSFVNFIQFYDPATHLHVDVGWSDDLLQSP